MSRVLRTSTVLSRIGIQSIFPRTAAAPAEDEPDHDKDKRENADDALRREVLRKGGRGVMVDKTV